MNAISVLSKAKKLGIQIWVQEGALKFKAPAGTLSDELKAEISAEKQAIIEFLESLGSSEGDAEPIQRVPRTSHLPLSYGQRWLYTVSQLDAESSTFNIPAIFRLRGDLNQKILNESFIEIIRRHEILRTNYTSVNGDPIQTVSNDFQLPLTVVDISSSSDAEKEIKVLTAFREEMEKPFDLAQGMLMRARLLKLADRDFVLVLGFHHIVCDNHSLNVFLQELSALYSSFAEGKPSALPTLDIQYADYAQWQNERLNGELKKNQVSYWKEKLKDMAAVPEIEGDFARPDELSHRSIRKNFILSPETVSTLKSLSQKSGCSLYVTFLSLLNVLLYQYSGHRDLLVGSPVAGRGRAELESLIGLFFNTVVLRTEIDERARFADLLNAVKKTTSEAFRNQEIPFDLLVEELKPPRARNKTPFFQVLFNMYNVRYKSRLHDLEIEPYNQDSVGGQNVNSKFDITLLAIEFETGIQLDFSFKADLFAPETVSWLVTQFEGLIRAVVQNHESRITDLVSLAPLKKREIEIQHKFEVFSKNETEQSIVARFEKAAGRYPEKAALESAQGQISYRETKVRADRLTRILREKIASPEPQAVALLMNHGTDMVLGMLGTLKSGNTFVTLDPSYPEDRLAFILKDTSAKIIVTDKHNDALGEKLRHLGAQGCELLNISKLSDAAPEEKDFSSPDHLAYIMYTSGSSGNPKGVMQNHRNVLHYTMNYVNGLHVGQDDRLSLIPTFSFSAAMMDVFAALTTGATLCLYDLKKDGPQNLGAWLNDQKITVYHSVPTVFRHFVGSLGEGLAFPHLRMIDFGGEPVTRRDIELFRKHFNDSCVLINGLGATELNVIRQFPVDHETEFSGNTVPVGFEVTDTKILLLDEAGHQLGFNQAGEIVIQSRYLSPGYWNLPDQTKAAFREVDDGKRRYHTGDLGLIRPDGCLVHLGRKDLQVKIHGVRIEPGEIEATILAQPGVKEAAVLAQTNSGGDKVLIAYLVAKEGSELSIDDLRSTLVEKLPPAMLPSEFVVLKAFPQTSTGKVDRRALMAETNQAEKSQFQEASTPMEVLLVSIGKEVLKKDRIGVTDSFFQLGGDSLLAAQFVSRVRSACNVDLTLRQVFRMPTIAAIAKHLEEIQMAQKLQALPDTNDGTRETGEL